MTTCTRTTVVRLDGARRRTDDGTGYLDARALFTKAGVFSYYDSKTGKIRRELRDWADVSEPESVASARHRPFTNDHPPVMLTAKNTRQHQAGFFYGEVEKVDNAYLASSLLITDESTILDYESGKRDVSMGYTCKLDETPGVHPVYGEYDAAQKRIRYNHCSLVRRGRMGPDCSVRADDSEAPAEARFDAYELPEEPQQRKDKKMGTIRLDDAALEADDALAVAVNAHIAQLKGRYDTLKTNFDKVEGERDQLQTNVTELKTKVDAFESVDLKAAAKEWADVTTKANAYLPKDFKMDEAKSPVDVMRAALQAAYPDQNLTGKSDDHIRGRFDMLEAKSVATKTQSSAAFQQGVTNKLAPAAGAPASKAGQRTDGAGDRNDQAEDPGLAAYQSMYPGMQPVGGKN